LLENVLASVPPLIITSFSSTIDQCLILFFELYFVAFPMFTIMQFLNEDIEVDVDGKPLSNPNLDVKPEGPYPAYMVFPVATTDGKEESYCI
jgi:hypothetical protein